MVRIIIGGQLSAVAPSVGEAAETEPGCTVAEHVDAIVTAMRKPFDQASGILVEAHGILGSVPLESTDEIVRRGGEGADA